MKLFLKLTLLMLVFISFSDADHIRRYRHSTLAKEVEALKTQHQDEIQALKSEIAEIKKAMHTNCAAAPHRVRHLHEERNHKLVLESAKAIHELRVKVKHLSNEVNSSNSLQKLKYLHHEVNRITTEDGYISNIARSLEARVDKIEAYIDRENYDKKNLDIRLSKLGHHLSLESKRFNHKLSVLEDEAIANNGVYPAPMPPLELHRQRHSKGYSIPQTTPLSYDQGRQFDANYQTIQVQLLAQRRRIMRLEELSKSSSTGSLTTRLDNLESQIMSLKESFEKEAVSDIAKMHASNLELREDLESVENKIDHTIPELRKEISKLDIDQAQMAAKYSYLKQDQETIKLSVKAVAVSVSNTQDRSVANLQNITRIGAAVADLTKQAKTHYSKLNDYILKSETKAVAPESDQNQAEVIIPLPELMGEVRELQPVEREYQELVAQLPKDCTNITEPAGSYIIRPGRKTVNAWCVDGNTVVQRRYNGSVEFNRKFAEYVRGFGDVTSEYWIGLETMYHLTSDNCSSMQIDMTDIYGAAWYALYENFSVGNAASGYVLNVGGFRGNASDSFEFQNHMQFSTIDHDRDSSNSDCAANYEGGWWFSHCQHVNINGKYTLGLTWFDSNRNEWMAIATSEVRVFRRPGCF